MVAAMTGVARPTLYFQGCQLDGGPLADCGVGAQAAVDVVLVEPDYRMGCGRMGCGRMGFGCGDVAGFVVKCVGIHVGS